MIYEIDILNGEMVLLDEDGNSHECCPLTTHRDAKQTIHSWLERYAFNVASAYRMLGDHFQAG